jgi:hypothetical protein
LNIYARNDTNKTKVLFAKIFEIIELPEPIFSVTIPVNRDQPGRNHYEALRRGGSYRDF